MADGDLLQDPGDLLGAHVPQGMPVHGGGDAYVLDVHGRVGAVRADGRYDRIPVGVVHRRALSTMRMPRMQHPSLIIPGTSSDRRT